MRQNEKKEGLSEGECCGLVGEGGEEIVQISFKA